MGGPGSGRNRLSTDTLKFNGTYREDYHGNRLETAVGEPTMPSGMTEEAKTHWVNVVPGLIDCGSAKSIDTDALASMCDWWSDYKYYSDTDNKDLAEKIRMGLKNLAYQNWTKMMAKFGMTPADRAKLTSDGTKEEDTLEGWLSK